MQILAPEEYELPWGLPRFTQDDRDLLFALNPREERVLKWLRTPRTTLHFLFQPGNFRARQRFFRFEIDDIPATAELVALLEAEYRAACEIPASG